MMNFKYIEQLLIHNRYGKVIQLLKNNQNIWSLNDYQRVYFLCCGFPTSNYKHKKEYFSETCVIYSLDHIHAGIQKHMCSTSYLCSPLIYNILGYITGSIKILKRQSSDYCINDTNNIMHPDTLRYRIKTQNIWKYTTISSLVLINCFIYDNNYTRLQSQYPRLYTKIRRVLYGYYKRCEYTKGQKLYDMMHILKITRIDFVHEMRYMWKYIHNKNVLGFCEFFMDKHVSEYEKCAMLNVVSSHDDYNFLCQIFSDFFVMTICKHKYTYRLNDFTYNFIRRLKWS
jgi:hypothetical protein